MNKIGTYSESSLHRSLKFRYSIEEKTEISIDSYVCDGQTESGELIEVQTGNFGNIREKIKKLVKKHKVRLIFPIILNKYLELYDVNGKLIRKKKSPKKENIWNLFDSLVYAPEFCLMPNLTLELSLLDIIEKRKDDGKGSWRRKGITIEDKIPIAWHESIILKKPKDYYLFLPFSSNDSSNDNKNEECFTVKDLSKKANISRPLAQKCIYVMHKTGLIERTGKQGNAYEYKKSALPLKTSRRRSL